MSAVNPPSSIKECVSKAAHLVLTLEVTYANLVLMLVPNVLPAIILTANNVTLVSSNTTHNVSKCAH